MLKRVLVANRGEIAVRIIRACREAGIETVAVYSKADINALHVQLATKAYCIGKERAIDSYLNMESILTIATATGCDAIHPGYGFLSENSQFARLCTECNIKFIGPSSEIIENMGNKSKARQLMIKSNVPVVPGSDGIVNDIDKAKEVIDKIGLPVLVKASAGGGGRGMRKIFLDSEIESKFYEAKAEAKACFANDDVYIEKLIINPKHIEFQILADKQGNVIHLGERDCSLQRKGQKMMEETPSPAISEDLRNRMAEDAIKAAKAVNYENAGTIEFVLDKDENYYFIEMNTRIQVEHPVTEMLTGIDLIHEQLRITAGLPLSTKEITFSGHAIECRINAEDINFMPSTGKITFAHFPGGYNTRVDTAVYQGYEISPFYDSMIGKIIVYGSSRLSAMRRMRRALEEMLIEGVETNASLMHIILHNKEIIKGTYDTGFIENNLDSIIETYKKAGGIDDSISKT